MCQGISAAFEKIPILPKIVEQLEEQLTQFVFSIMAPFIVPLIRQLRAELKTGSDEIIQSSKNEQHIVFEKDNWSDPTHSMLSKDHFSVSLTSICLTGNLLTCSRTSSMSLLAKAPLRCFTGSSLRS